MAAETPSASRASTNDSPSQGPIAIFDQQLKYLSDSYLSFFQERARIEEAYIESLLRLHKKSKALDGSLDDKAEPTTTRQVWGEVRDGLEREAQARQAFLGALTVDVLTPLSTLRDSQDRTRKRIKEDIKESANAHQEYAENVLPRLKRNYTKKCQEVEDNKSNAAVPNIPIGQDVAPVLAPSRSNPNTAPVVTSPQPLRPLSRRASGHQPAPRNRSPSTTNPLQDLAHQGKRQLNQLMTFLDNKGGTVKDGITGSRGDVAIKTVKAKRDANEADTEYRKGVHWLETLRLRRIKIMEGAFKSLEFFIDESATKLKSVLEKYTQNSMATSTTHVHLFTHAHSQVERIAPQKDIASLMSFKPRYLQQATPRRTLYTNYYVGDCNDLIFGVGLVDYATSRGLHDGDVPKILRICIAEVDKRGLNSEGIYRVSGRHAVVHDIMHKIEKDERNFQFFPNDDVFAIASLLKQYLRELPEPVFKFPLEDRVKHTEELDDHVQNNFLFLRARMRRLPPVHQATLKAIVEHLARVAANSEKNKMDVKNLAIIFGGVIFGEDEVAKATDLLSMQSWKDSLMEDLITHASVLFDERHSGTGSLHLPLTQSQPTSAPPPSLPLSPSQLLSPTHPLPPAPTDEPPASYGYGSSYTQVANMPPPSSRHQKTPSQSSQAGRDFAPQLPSRPDNSIHPSRRANMSNRTAGTGTDDEEALPSAASAQAPSLPPRPSSSTGTRTGADVNSFASESTDATLRGKHPLPAESHRDEPQREGSGSSSIDDDAFVSAQGTPVSPRSPLSPELLGTDASDDADGTPKPPSARTSFEHPAQPGPP